MSHVRSRPDAFAACNEHLQEALVTLLPDANDLGLYKITRFDGGSDMHKCFCKQPADFYFLRLTRVSQRLLDRLGITVSRV